MLPTFPRENHEETSHKQVEPQTITRPRLPEADELTRRTPHAQPSTAKRPLAADPSLTNRAGPSPRLARLTLTQSFRAVYRRGRWAKGVHLSVGTVANRDRISRLGLRTRRGLKGAVVRNRLKRQMRSLVGTGRLPWRTGLDIVIVMHPSKLPISSTELKTELAHLCRRAGAIS